MRRVFLVSIIAASTVAMLWPDQAMGQGFSITRSVTVKIKKADDAATITVVGYGRFEGSKLLILNLIAPDGYLIESSDCDDTDGSVMWLPHPDEDSNREKAAIHTWTAGAFPTFDDGEKKSHAATFTGVLVPDEGGEGEGGEAKKLEFEVRVGDIDLDADTDNDSADTHRPPSASLDEDTAEYPQTAEDTVVGLLLPLNDNNDVSWENRDSKKYMTNYAADKEILNAILKINARKAGTFTILGGSHYWLYDHADHAKNDAEFDTSVLKGDGFSKALRLETMIDAPSGYTSTIMSWFTVAPPFEGTEPSDYIKYTLVGVDIDVDSNNDETIEGTNGWNSGEDFYEAHPANEIPDVLGYRNFKCGIVVPVNENDSDGNGHPDNGWNLDPAENWDGPDADTVQEGGDRDDLRSMILRGMNLDTEQSAAIDALAGEYGVLVALRKAGGTGHIRIFTDEDEPRLVMSTPDDTEVFTLPEGAFGLDPEEGFGLPTLWQALHGSADRSFLIEGLSPGQVVLEVAFMRYLGGDAGYLTYHADRVTIMVATAGISSDIDVDGNTDFDDETREAEPGLLVMVNNNDSDHDGTVDTNDGRIPTGENELKAVSLTNLLPELLRDKGKIRLRRTSEDFAVYSDRRKGVAADYDRAILRGTFSANDEGNGQKTWDLENAQQRSDFAALVTAGLWVEGLAATTASDPPRLRLIYLPIGSTTEVELDWIVINTAQCQVMEDTNDNHNLADDNAVTHLNIGHWGKDRAGGTLSGYNGNNVRNAADPGNFVEEDTDRFYLRVTAPWANANNGAVDTLGHISLGTYTAFGAATPAMDDDFTQQTNVTETGADTGVFVSPTHLLCSPDLPVADNPDDDYAAGVFAADEADNDRTHRVSIDGALAVELRKGDARARFELPVSDRATEYRRIADIRIHVFREPFQDVGYDHDNDPGTPKIGAGNGLFDYADTNGNGQHDAGEPSEPFSHISGDGIRNTVLGSEQNAATHVAAQLGRCNIAWAQAGVKVSQNGNILFVDAPLLANGNSILLDGDFDFGAADETAMVNAYSGGSVVSRIEAFFTGSMAGINGLSRTPSDQIAGMGERTWVYMAPSLDIRLRTLAHELGHCLDNAWDNNNPQYVFYPANNTHLDNAYNQYRRITHDTETNCRTVRPAGQMMATGNRILRNP